MPWKYLQFRPVHLEPIPTSDRRCFMKASASGHSYPIYKSPVTKRLYFDFGIGILGIKLC
ncbi:uncharacterized protein Bfra_003570 [Botrytis fragariae]|uniref:Uncharacterized protein n=1 Tax=Botrytis fragariae TaxID=1964551 RepID=A0A8H6EK12_9HELO|nr:uncharacterized protein Bfra_003570 [Botrytis fragariae]KAF5875117.1 hypothetical protein Bfra_003570 [Botrytis fragariae]